MTTSKKTRQKPDEQPQAKISASMTEDMAAGRYATMTALSVREHEALLTFIAQDPFDEAEEPRGHVVSRIWLSRTHLRSLRDLIDRQLAKAEELEKKAAKKHAAN